MAASITVDKTADDDTNGSCTLWDAITAANTDTATNGCPAGSGADTITLAVNITLSADLPWITSEITIEGANYDIDGNDEHHIFWIDGGDLTVNNITLTGGRAGSYGGAINADDDSTLTVTNSRLEDNYAGLLGGAIATSNTNVVIKNSVFVGNSSGSLGGALSFFSNDPSDVGWTDDDEIKTLLIDQTTFGEDVPAGCAAADISADPENEASASGGALDLAGGNATIRRSSFIGNKAGTDGGAIHASLWNFLFENNTVSCNRADGDGGGLYVIVGDLILRHSTIYQNSAGDDGGGLYSIDDSEFYPDADSVTWGLYLQNSIIAGSTGGGDCTALDEIDHNIGMYIGDGTCEPACSAQDGPINLGDLQGEPAYHPLLDGSIAINRADVEVCSLPEATETPDPADSQTVRSQQAQDFSDTNICGELAPQQDQIGTNRPMYGNCDIGAIESRTGEEMSAPLGPGENVDPVDTDTPIPPPPTDTNTPVPPPPTDTDTPVPPPPTDTDTPVPPPPTDTDTPVPPPPPDTDTPVPPPPPDTDTPVPPPPSDTPDAVNGGNNGQGPQDPQNPRDPQDPENPQEPDDNADATETAAKRTEDAAATTTRAFWLTETSIYATQTADQGTYEANQTATRNAQSTETAVALLPPAEQTGLAFTATRNARLTETAVALLPPAEQTDFALTATSVYLATSVAATATAEADFALTATASPGPEARCTYTVAFGDTLFGLAQSFGATVDQIRKLNQLPDNSLLAGQLLIIPDCYDPIGDDLESATLGFSCQNLFDSAVVRTTSRVVNCRVVDIGLIDKHPALASGMIAALDILGYVESGVEVCFRSVGDLVFLDPGTNPPTPRTVESYSNRLDMTCGEIDEVGTLVLVATITEQDTYVELTNCRVTTTQTLRLREHVGGTGVLGLVPYNVVLGATARTNHWFRVTFLGTEGWISARYAKASGICR